MADKSKPLKSLRKKHILAHIPGLGEDDLGDRVIGRVARDLINQVLSKAGKSKDDIIQVLGREIGFALAAMLKEPLEQLVKSKKIRISVELVSKSDTGGSTKSRPAKTKDSANKS